MAKVDAGGQIVLDTKQTEPISGWAILVHGRTRPDLLFATQGSAEARRVIDHSLAHCEIVPVIVTGDTVVRIG